MTKRDLSFFFSDKVQAPREEIELVVSDRFKDADGKPLKWVFRLLNIEEINKIQEEAVSIEREEGKIATKANIVQMKLDTILRTLIYPDLKNIELQESYGAKSEASLLNKMLEGREIEQLGSKLIREQGLIEGFDDLLEEAKN